MEPLEWVGWFILQFYLNEKKYIWNWKYSSRWLVFTSQKLDAVKNCYEEQVSL